MNFQFSQTVRDLSFTVFDIDFGAGRFADWIKATGTGSAIYNAAVTTPYNSTGTPGGSPPSTVSIGGGGSAGQAFGVTGGSGNLDDFGNATFAFAPPLTSIQMRYGNRNAGAGGPLNQAIALHDISFCLMPEIELVKSVDTEDDSGIERFAVPDADMIYTLSVSNTGGSQVTGAEL
ncbi:MAG: hypothetical protein AAGD40_10740, partial [Pseudomonadota bacterium]